MIKLTVKANDLLAEAVEETDVEKGQFKVVSKNNKALNELLGLGLVETAPHDNKLMLYVKASPLGEQVINGEVENEVVFDDKKQKVEKMNEREVVQTTAGAVNAFAFENNVAIPVTKREVKSKFDGIPFGQMQVGQSFVMEVEDKPRAKENFTQALTNYSKRRNFDMKFTVRMVEGSGTPAVRVWRTA